MFATQCISVEETMDDSKLIPPAQDSPKHILNVLNDKCIQEIFNQLISNLEDFLSASEVCKRFQENATVCYSESSEKRITITSHQSSSLPPGSVSFDRAYGFLKAFGQSLQSIYLVSIRDEKYIFDENYTADQKPIDDTLNMIADFCGRNLTKLSTHTGYIDFNTRSQFKVLERLSIATGLVYNLATFPELKLLEVRSCKIKHANLFARTFPKLKKAVFCSIEGSSDDAFIRFQTHNPQLKKLWLTCLYPNVCITSLIVRDIGNRTPDLTDLTLICNKDQFLMNNLAADIMHLSGLQKLQNLRIECKRAPFSAKLLIDSFAENNVPIENLQIHGAYPDFVESLPRLQQLKKLNLLNVPENMVGQLHGLQELFIEGEVTIAGVKQILERHRNLNKLIVTAQRMMIDHENYDKVLALAKDLCVVFITCYDGLIDVQPSVLRKNSKWLHILMTSRK
ncbi:uncharacterized protein LOC129569940 isoform X2 [Sitodiplosis mosellana]|uniref:uncharacterized protein LOC129569940 isoform X2 n=1 Tax=Sitodiplosis mosellana TaxID=263140 RepID=UPI002443D26F|nr:uncharacterized protein LOC129569940 isoform X2 [Sitodiplosis mosellana]